MKKRTKVLIGFISAFLLITMLWVAFISIGLYVLGTRFVHTQGYGICVAGVDVTRENQEDVLGDGTVSYSPGANMLTLNNANIEYDYSVIYSSVDLMISLVGENTFVCKGGTTMPAIYAANYYLTKDISFSGEGSLTVDYQTVYNDSVAIYAEDVYIDADITVNMLGSSNISNGILCSNLYLGNNSPTTATVNNGSAKYCTAVCVRGSAVIGMDSSLVVSSDSGAAVDTKGVVVNGDLIMQRNSSVSVTVKDAQAEESACLAVSGLLEVSTGATLTASAEKTCAIECFGSMRMESGSTVNAESDGGREDILCYGVIVNYGGEINAETVEPFGGIFEPSVPAE